MALRKSSVLTGLAALGFSCWVSALGLGELTLHSALDEPFDAEIELVNIGESDENQILVGLASKEDFKRAGVAWEFHLLNLKFKTDLSDADHPVVKVSSKESIKEPYLDFVAQLQWPSGLLLREYTLFLDLPVFDTNKSAASTTAATSLKSAKQSTSSSDARSSEAPSGQKISTGPVSTTTRTMAAGGADYRVKGGDTLWKIASRAESGATTVQQRMVAIYDANLNAFANGNANLLKKGAVLRMPGLASVESINPDEAQQRVSAQARAWNEQHKQAAVRELIGDVPATTQSKMGNSKEGLLRLSTATETKASNPQQLGHVAGSEGSSAASEVLQNELSIAQEELNRSKRENLELKAKLEGLEAQLTTQSKLLELESDELKAVQLGVSADKAATEAETEKVSTPTVDETTETTAIVSGDDGTGDAGPNTETESVVKGPLSGLFTFLQSNWMPLLGFLVVLLGVIFLIAKSKKDDQPAQVEPFLSPDIDTAETEQESVFDSEFSQEDEPTVEAETSIPEFVSLDDAEPEEIEEVDPIGEADIYQSLGNFSEAESVIEKAIEASPNESKLHLKRLDLFAAQHDIERFDAYYPTLVALGDDTATATADRLRANIPEPEVVEESGELTLEQQVAEELGIADLELDLSSTKVSQDTSTDEDPLSEDIETELASSFVESGADELDLSGIELDFEPSKSTTTDAASEEPDKEFDTSMFGDISLPDELDELSAGLDSEEASSEVELELPDFESDELGLQDAQLERTEDEGLELSLDSLDFDSDDGLELDAGTDESSTQLELAQAYIEMGDESGAKDILAEVANKGSDEQKEKANELLAKIA